jgi:hypothetical protein
MKAVVIAAAAGLALFPRPVTDRVECRDWQQAECRAYLQPGETTPQITSVYLLLSYDGFACQVSYDDYISVGSGKTFDCDWRRKREVR